MNDAQIPNAAGDAPPHGWQSRRHQWLRRTLRLSQQEAVASSTTTATGDNYFNAFGVYLGASAPQMGVLTAIPQFVGALMQLLSVWLGGWLPRRPLVVVAATAQAGCVLLLALVALWHGGDAVYWLIGLAVLYHAALNLIQPQWRAWMGSIVPQRRRGAFFAARTRLTMVSTLVVFVGGGALLTLCQKFDVPWLGFFALFALAAAGRGFSARLLWRMHDPDPHQEAAAHQGVGRSFAQMRAALADPVFRHYTLFVAGMQGVVAVSAPFFAVYMLRELEFTYLHFSINNAASVAMQFATLRFWGRFSDRFGNRLVMLVTASLIPPLPLLWTFSTDWLYLIGVEMVSGFAWSGFTLATANYLYDIRPHKTDFALYAAVQSALSAAAVFVGALAGGLIAAAAPAVLAWLPGGDAVGSPFFIVFLASALGRMAVTAWFIPRAVEPRIRRRPQLLEIVYRVSRLNAVSGVVLDWLTVTRRRR